MPYPLPAQSASHSKSASSQRERVQKRCMHTVTLLLLSRCVCASHAQVEALLNGVGLIPRLHGEARRLVEDDEIRRRVAVHELEIKLEAGGSTQYREEALE
jgi:hypothetical protein